MDRKSRFYGQGLAVALILLAGIGGYTLSLKHRLDATVSSIGALEQDRNQWKSKAEQAAGLVDGASASLEQCSAQVDVLKSSLAPPDP